MRSARPPARDGRTGRPSGTHHDRSLPIRLVILRDLAIFQVKLALDGLKDVVFMPFSILAAALGLLFPGERPGHRFYFVLRLGERFDRWLSLFSAAEKACTLDDGLFGACHAGSATFLGRLEQIVLGEAEAGSRPGEEPA